MPEDQKIPQNSIPTENPSPVSPQEPTEPASENTRDSEPSNMPPESLESPRNDSDLVPVNNDNGVLNQPESQTPELDKTAQTEQNSEPVNTPQTPTAQIPANEPLSPEFEPLASEPEIKLEPLEIPEVKTEEVSEPEVKPESEIVSQPEIKAVPEELPPSSSLPEEKPRAQNFARELLIKARSAVQSRKRKKLDKVMTMFIKKNKITNDEIEKLLHVSDATATRYLSQLEKEGKIKQNRKTGKGVSYSKLI